MVINNCSCGAKATVFPYGEKSHQVICGECGASGIPGDNPVEAIGLWNMPVPHILHLFEDFPKGVTWIIDKVFEGEYRIGYRFRDTTYSPGIPSYYSFDEAMERCYRAFRDRFM